MAGVRAAVGLPLLLCSLDSDIWRFGLRTRFVYLFVTLGAFWLRSALVLDVSSTFFVPRSMLCLCVGAGVLFNCQRR